ncbi:FHA domain-containing protein [Chloroflexales bacterium ZM16-3]|nr:FHA domain-containing protein [Chloroflexales bacterium ZM16-3]
MSAYQRLTINIFDKGDEAAEVQPKLKPVELIAAILAEFGDDLPYLSLNPSGYHLLRGNGTPLIDDTPIGSQLGSETRVVLAERIPQIPPQATALPAPLYLREPKSGKVFPLHWSPALIGRSDSNLPDEALLAVNLNGLPHSERVSRRHARITYQGGKYVFECLADNPVVLRTAGGEIPLTGNRRHQIQPNDMIVLEFSQIQLHVLQRNG